MIGRFFGGVVSVIVIAGRFVYEVVFVWPTPEERRQSERHEEDRRKEERQDADAVLDVLLPTLGQALELRAYTLMGRHGFSSDQLGGLLVDISRLVSNVLSADSGQPYTLFKSGHLSYNVGNTDIIHLLMQSNWWLSYEAVQEFLAWVVAGARFKSGLIPGHATRPCNPVSIFVDVGEGYNPDVPLEQYWGVS